MVRSRSTRPWPRHFTRRFDYAAAARTIRARAHHAEKPLLVTRLAAAAACYACLRLRAALGAAAVAFVALLQSRDPKRLVLASGGVFERDLQIVTQIRSALYGRPSARSAAEHIAEPEHLEYVVEIGVTALESAESGTCADALMPKTVVRCSFLLVREDRVCLGGFFESLLGGGIVRVLVGMILHCKSDRPF